MPEELQVRGLPLRSGSDKGVESRLRFHVCGWHLLAELPSRLESAAHGKSGRNTREEVGFLEPGPRQGFAQHASKGRDSGGASGGEHYVDLVRGQAARRDRQLNASARRADLRANGSFEGGARQRML